MSVSYIPISYHANVLVFFTDYQSLLYYYFLLNKPFCNHFGTVFVLVEVEAVDFESFVVVDEADVFDG
jgi:hypothetical protein